MGLHEPIFTFPMPLILTLHTALSIIIDKSYIRDARKVSSCGRPPGLTGRKSIRKKTVKKQKAKKDNDEGRLEKIKDQGRGNRKHYTKIKNWLLLSLLLSKSVLGVCVCVFLCVSIHTSSQESQLPRRKYFTSLRINELRIKEVKKKSTQDYIPTKLKNYSKPDLVTFFSWSTGMP